MPESIQHKLDRVRPPRVQITYDVETLGSIVKTELPFVVGIMADLSGYDKKLRRMPDAKRPPLKDRKFVEIDRDNFNEIMERLAPRVTAGGVELEFKTLEDFNPINVLRNVPALRTMFESRTRLSNLLAKLDGNPALQKSLVEAIKNLSANSDDRQALQAYIEVNLHDQAGQGEALTPFDADALVKLIPAAQQKVVKNYIVERYPDTVTPDVATMAAGVDDSAQQTELKAHILEQYPYVVTGDAATLAAAITDAAQQTALKAHIAKTYPSTAATAPTDLAAIIAALSDTQRRELKSHIARTYPDTVTDEVKDLVARLRDADKDELKDFILATWDMPSVSVKTAREGLGSKVSLTVLMNSLKAHEKKELTDYIEKTYPAQPSEPKGDA
ncbi:MAG TPA: type VI secretion system contractile sheath small subunit [Pyrinomonadaceae bacterium]|nr:type VI secretion system contractile sheath small subunit [Pyrinomonadaceae bacterium]